MNVRDHLRIWFLESVSRRSVRADRNHRDDADAGVGLVEMLIAITLLATALLGTAGEIAVYMKQQVVEKSQITANHLATSWFEYAESLERSATAESVTGGVTTSTTSISQPTTSTVKVNGVTYTETMTPHICTPAQLAAGVTAAMLSSCNGAVSPVNTIFSTITITWKIGAVGHTLTMTRNLADNTAYTPANTTDPNANGLSNCTRAGTVVTKALAITSPSTTAIRNTATTPAQPGPAYVDGGSGNPTYDGNGTAISVVTATVTETGLVNTTDTTQTYFGAPTCVPLTWTDSTGTHQVDMHSSGCGTITKTNYTTTPCTYAATIQTTSVTKKATELTADNGYDATLPFCAWLLGTGTCSSTTSNDSTNNDAYAPFYVNLGPSVTCTRPTTISVAVDSALGKVTNGTVGTTAVTCTTTNLKPVTTGTTPDTVTVSALGTKIATLTYSTTNKNWTGTIPALTKVTNSCGVGNCSVTLTFKVTRGADGTTQLTPYTLSGTTFTLSPLTVLAIV